MRLSVNVKSAVRFRNAQAFSGRQSGVHVAGSLEHYVEFDERSKTSRKAVAEEKSDELPAGDVYNRWMC